MLSILSSRLGSETVVTCPEEDLLLQCGRMAVGAEWDEQISLPQGELDWQYLIRMARVHGMLPHLHSYLEICPGGVPSTVMDQLHEDFRRNTWRNVFLAGELLRLLEALSAKGISTIPFKGPVLGMLLYGNVALRQFVDLDILVHEQDVVRAKDLLITQGYRPQFKLAEHQLPSILQSDSELAFTREDGASVVDLQWRFRPEYFSFPLDMQSVWERVRPFSFMGKNVLTLSPEDLLLFLCVHGTKHIWGGLSLICDLARFIQVNRETTDWDQLLTQARRVRSERMLFLGLFLGSDLLGARLPDEVWRRVRAHREVEALALRVRRNLFKSEEKAGIPEHTMFHLRSREYLRDRINYCLHFAATPTERDLALLPFPKALSSLYYALRPFRLLTKYSLGLFRRSP